MADNMGQARDTINWLLRSVTPLTVADIEPVIRKRLDVIKALFQPGAKVTLVVRNPDYGDDAGIVVTDEPDLEDAIAELRRAMAEE